MWASQFHPECRRGVKVAFGFMNTDTKNMIVRGEIENAMHKMVSKGMSVREATCYVAVCYDNLEILQRLVGDNIDILAYIGLSCGERNGVAKWALVKFLSSL